MMKSLNKAFLGIYIPVIIRLETDLVEITDSWNPQTLSQPLLELLADVSSRPLCHGIHPHWLCWSAHLVSCMLLSDHFLKILLFFFFLYIVVPEMILTGWSYCFNFHLSLFSKQEQSLLEHSPFQTPIIQMMIKYISSFGNHPRKAVHLTEAFFQELGEFARQESFIFS